MIKFIFKGIVRDRSKSLIPVLVITVGVMVTVLMSGFLKGVLSDIVNQNAKLDTGHLKIMTQPYAENKDQMPNDLALLDLQDLQENLNQKFNNVLWTPRIKFGGIIDVPDSNGNTKTQGTGMGMALSILDSNSVELDRLNFNKSIQKGRLPMRKGEIVLSDAYAEKLKISPGDEITYFGTTMEGSMVFQNFVMTGTINFGSPLLDKGTFIMDIKDAQDMLDMEDGTGELLGYFNSKIYNDIEALQIAEEFNSQFINSKD